MMAKCTECETTFDSHDGGFACGKCGATYCPACEVWPEGSSGLHELDEPICPKCNGLDYLEKVQVQVPILKPKLMQSRRALRLYYCAFLCGLSIAMALYAAAPTSIMVKVRWWCPTPFWLVMAVGAFLIAMGNFSLILKNDKGKK